MTEFMHLTNGNINYRTYRACDHYVCTGKEMYEELENGRPDSQEKLVCSVDEYAEYVEEVEG